MVATQHPRELNPFQRFRQAAKVLRGTTRAANPFWYRNGLEQDFQLHLRCDSNRIEAFYFSKPSGAWTPAPAWSGELPIEPEAMASQITEAIARAKQEGASGLGVIFHVADEFATAELKPELDNPGALNELRTTIESEPSTLLDDASLSENDFSWRLIPYPAAGSDAIATTVTLSRRHAPLLEAFRQAGTQANFPVVTRALSAPLVTLLALPEVKRDEMTRPLIAVLSYPRFTLLAFFNEHGDLRLLRTLQHRGQRRPTNLRHAASTTAAALELAEPEVFVLSTGDVIDPQLVADLQLVFPAASIREIDWSGILAATPGQPLPPEPLIATSLLEKPAGTPLASSHTFTVLKVDGWAVQDFLPMSQHMAEIFPSRGEMKLLRSAMHAGLVFGVLALGGLCFFGFQMIDMIRKPEWAFDASSAINQKQRLAILTSERGKIDHWDNLLEDRSKAWTAMELLPALFPEKAGFMVKNFQYATRSEAPPGQTKAGFSREWKITGLTGETGLEQLAILNTRDGVSAIFDQVARQTGNHAFVTNLPSRNLVVNVRTLENVSYRPGPAGEAVGTDETTYPFSFDLTITQRFESSDPLAITTAKAP